MNGITQDDLEALEALQNWLYSWRKIGTIQDEGTTGLYIHINVKRYAAMLGIKSAEYCDG
jgi:hypothetical protein